MKMIPLAGALAFLLLPTAALADDKDAAVDKLKKTAQENWDRVGAGPVVMETTEHLLILGPKGMEDKLKEMGAQMEKSYDRAVKTLYTPKDTPIKGLMTVYLLPEADQVAAFYRRVLKRRPLGMERGAYSVEDDKLFVVIGPPREKTDPPTDVQSMQQVASAMLQRRAGARTLLPSWLANGFGRATWYRLNLKPTDINRERMNARRLFAVKKRTATDIWNGLLEAEEAELLEPSLADFFAYGPGRMKFVTFLEGFRPGENEESKSMDQALHAAELKADVIIKRFKEWINLPD
jgi:hypothetical protein